MMIVIKPKLKSLDQGLDSGQSSHRSAFLAPSQRKLLGGFLFIFEHHPSVRVPADLEQKDSSVQCMIPGDDATRGYIPTRGSARVFVTCTIQNTNSDFVSRWGNRDHTFSIVLNNNTTIRSEIHVEKVLFQYRKLV